MREVRVADGSFLRLIGTCLHVGVRDGEAVLEPELGTVQGSVLSPLLGNVYLHSVLDRWFETEVKPRLRGKATLIRSCDDCMIGFEREEDARRVLAVLEKRLGRFGLALHPEKTRLLPFWRPPTTQQSGQGPATFDVAADPDHPDRSPGREWHHACHSRQHWADPIAAAEERGRAADDHAECGIRAGVSIRQSDGGVSPEHRHALGRPRHAAPVGIQVGRCGHLHLEWKLAFAWQEMEAEAGIAVQGIHYEAERPIPCHALPIRMFCTTIPSTVVCKEG
jgi:hypothetical protein